MSSGSASGTSSAGANSDVVRARATTRMTRGEEAERRVSSHLRAALTDGAVLYENVRWTGPVRRSGPARDGEADVVIAHPDRGVLVMEVKSGTPSRDRDGRWHIGDHSLPVSPFEQASTSAHVLHDKLVDLPGWPVALDPLTAHAVAFPDVDLASLPRGHACSAPDAPTDLVLDATALESVEATRRWLDGAFDYWTGDGAGRRPPGAAGMALIDELLRPTVSLRRLVRGRIADDREELISASLAQARILNHARSMRRVEVDRSGGQREVAHGRREGAHPGSRGLPDAARLLQPAPRDDPRSRARQTRRRPAA